MNDNDKEWIVEAMVETMVMVTFDTHYYQWEGKIRKQSKGGPIGLCATGSVAKAVMAVFMVELERKLKDAGVEVILLKSYVDDVLVVAKNVELGSKFNKDTGKVEVDADLAAKHSQENTTKDTVTLRVITEVANNIISFLEFTGEQSQGKNEPVPVLDAQAWFGPTPTANK